jgi:hypothetical protein
VALAASTARVGYAQHRPERTLLYQIVAEHLESFLDEARSAYARGLPNYVERELRAYLACGIQAHGFLRARCRQCGKDLLVAFSCKKRGVCPSCNARRMCGTAAHLVDHVFPGVPVRQWVLSVPFELRLLLAKNHRALSAVGRIFVREVFHWQREQAALRGIPRARGGAVCFPQRFGGSLNLNVHYHVAVPDGVFTEGGDRAAFHHLPHPSQGDLETIAINVEARVLTWLGRRGFLAKPDDDTGEQQDSRSALDACLEGSLGLGELTALPGGAIGNDDLALPMPSKPPRRAGRSRGFDINAGVVVSASDHEGRERLLRYCARPALSLERLSRLPDGRVAYALRKPWGRQTHRVMDPTTFLARLAALVPPPRHPLVRFHGVFAPHSAWRKKVVPEASATPSRCAAGGAGGGSSPPTEPSGEQPVAVPRRDGRGRGAAAQLTPDEKSPSRTEPAVAAELPRFSFGRIDWAALLKRVYDVNALACPCGGRLHFIALILRREVAQSILESLGMPSEPPPIARARSPDLRDPIPSED